MNKCFNQNNSPTKIISPKNNLKKHVKSNVFAAVRKVPKYKENLRMSIQKSIYRS